MSLCKAAYIPPSCRTGPGGRRGEESWPVAVSLLSAVGQAEGRGEES